MVVTLKIIKFRGHVSTCICKKHKKGKIYVVITLILVLILNNQSMIFIQQRDCLRYYEKACRHRIILLLLNVMFCSENSSQEVTALCESNMIKLHHNFAQMFRTRRVIIYFFPYLSYKWIHFQRIDE